MKIEVIDGKVSLTIDGTYSAEELSKLVQQIGQARAQIAKDPENPVGLAMEGQPIDHWYTERNAFLGLHQLSLRTNLGWQTFLLSPPHVGQLIHHLAAQLTHVLLAQTAPAAALSGPDNNSDGSASMH